MNEDGDSLGALPVYNRIELIRGMIVPDEPITYLGREERRMNVT